MLKPCLYSRHLPTSQQVPTSHCYPLKPRVLESAEITGPDNWGWGLRCTSMGWGSGPGPQACWGGSKAGPRPHRQVARTWLSELEPRSKSLQTASVAKCLVPKSCRVAAHGSAISSWRQRSTTHTGAEPDLTAPTLLPRHYPESLMSLFVPHLFQLFLGTGPRCRHRRESPMIHAERSITRCFSCWLEVGPKSSPWDLPPRWASLSESSVLLPIEPGTSPPCRGPQVGPSHGVQAYFLTCPPLALLLSHAVFFLSPQRCHMLSCLWAFPHAVPFALTALFCLPLPERICLILWDPVQT